MNAVPSPSSASPSALRSLNAATVPLLCSGSRFEMAQVEVGGVPVRVWAGSSPHLRAVLEASLEHGDREALVFEGERISHTEHFRRAATLARRLVEDYGVARGDRVALAMRNYPEWVTAFFAAVSVGAIVVPVNAWLSAPELEFVLRDSGARLLVADSERLERLGAALERLDLAVIAVRCAGPLPRGARAWAEVLGEVAPMPCRPRWPWPPTIPPRSSTPRGPPAGPGARWGRTATWSATCCPWPS